MKCNSKATSIHKKFAKLSSNEVAPRIKTYNQKSVNKTSATNTTICNINLQDVSFKDIMSKDFKKTSLSLSPKNHQDSFLPNQAFSKRNIKTLLIDLDETLVHSTYDHIPCPDIVIPVRSEQGFSQICVLVRPYARQFLQELSNYFELVIYTASLSRYADPLISQLDPNGKVHFRLFREHCSFVDGVYLKNLSKLGRDLKNVIMIDNSPLSYSLQHSNGIPISSWFEDKEDDELLRLIPLLRSLAKCSDVRNELYKFIHNDSIIWNKVDLYLSINRPDYNKELDSLIQTNDQSEYYNFLTNEDISKKEAEVDNKELDCEYDNRINEENAQITKKCILDGGINNLNKQDLSKIDVHDSWKSTKNIANINPQIDKMNPNQKSMKVPSNLTSSKDLSVTNTPKTRFRLTKNKNYSFQNNTNNKNNNNFPLSKKLESSSKQKNLRESIKSPKIIKPSSSYSLKKYISKYTRKYIEKIEDKDTNLGNSKPSNLELYKNQSKIIKSKDNVSSGKTNNIDVFAENMKLKNKKAITMMQNKNKLNKSLNLSPKNYTRNSSKDEKFSDETVKIKNLYENFLKNVKNLGRRNDKIDKCGTNTVNNFIKNNVSDINNYYNRIENRDLHINRTNEYNSKPSIILKTNSSNNKEISLNNSLIFPPDLRRYDTNNSLFKMANNKNITKKTNKPKLPTKK